MIDAQAFFAQLLSNFADDGAGACHTNDQQIALRIGSVLIKRAFKCINNAADLAQAFIGLGFKLGFGGAITYERALKLRDLAQRLPLDSLVLETDAPDMPPQWLYRTAEQRQNGQPQGRNCSAQLPCIAQQLAQLRGMEVADLAQATSANARVALRGLPAWRE